MTTRKSTVRQSFNQRFVNSLKPPKKGRAVFYDANNPDLGLRVEPSGRKTFFWFKKVAGQPLFRKIGTWPATDIDVATGHAHKLSADLDAYARAGYKGPNPFAKDKKPSSATPTFKMLVDAYCEHHPRAEAATRWMFKKYCPGWDDRRVDAITLEDVLTVRNALGTHYHSANRLVERIRAVYNWAGVNENGKINFWSVSNPTRNVKLYSKKKHEPRRKVYLKPQELVRFDRTLRKEKHGDLRDFLVLANTTGARRSNVLAMKWTDFDFDTRVWALDKTKTNPYNVTLSPAALKVLERRRREIAEDVLYVFPSFGASGHLIDLKKQWHRFREAADIPHIRIHDLRRTKGSYAAMAGASMRQIAELLGHSTEQATACYSEVAPEVVEQASLAGERKMLEMMKLSQRRTKRLAAPRQQRLLAGKQA
jgi:integrase